MNQEEPKAKLLRKKCNCGEQCKKFILAATYLPHEPRGIPFYENLAKIGRPSFIPAGKISQYEVFRLYFTSECGSCGMITSWLLTPDEINLIVSDDSLRSEGFGIQIVYRKEFFKEIVDKTDIRLIKDYYTEVIEFIERFETPKGENDGELKG